MISIFSKESTFEDETLTFNACSSQIPKTQYNQIFKLYPYNTDYLLFSKSKHFIKYICHRKILQISISTLDIFPHY